MRNNISMSFCLHPTPPVILKHTPVICRMIARECYLDADHSFSVPSFFCYVSYARLLPLSFALSRIFFSLLPQSGDRFEHSFAACTISAGCELRICACACTRLHTSCILLPWTTGLFFLYVFCSVFPQHHGWPHSADTCVIFFFRFTVSFSLPLLDIFMVLLSTQNVNVW